MKRVKMIIVTGLVLMTGVAVASEADVQGQIQLLRQNLENSRANLQQYRANMEASSANAVEATQAVRQLREQRTQLNQNTSNIEKNKALIDQVQKQIQGFQKEEAAQLATEQKQIAELRAILEALEKNKAQREKNIQVYQAQLQQLEQDKEGWDSQRTALAELNREIDLKEQQALAQRQKWLDRRQAYREEAVKWHRQSQVAEQSYTRARRLND